jgi:phosphate transport system protein
MMTGGQGLRPKFDEELLSLQEDVLLMGSWVEEALVQAVDGLKRRDLAASQAVIACDRAINEKRYRLEADTIALIATQQPMARDMRLLAAILEIAAELERIGDYAKSIAHISLAIGPQPLIAPLLDLPRMADKTCSMLRQALNAFIRRDIELARAIPRQDDEIDALHNQFHRIMVSYILTSPSTLDQVTYLLRAAHNLERAADRVTNICERVAYTITGRMEEFDVDRTDPKPSLKSLDRRTADPGGESWLQEPSCTHWFPCLH